MKRNTDYFRVEEQASPGSYITNTECCCPNLLMICDQQSGVIKNYFYLTNRHICIYEYFIITFLFQSSRRHNDYYRSL